MEQKGTRHACCYSPRQSKGSKGPASKRKFILIDLYTGRGAPAVAIRQCFRSLCSDICNSSTTTWARNLAPLFRHPGQCWSGVSTQVCCSGRGGVLPATCTASRCLGTVFCKQGRGQREAVWRDGKGKGQIYALVSQGTAPARQPCPTGGAERCGALLPCLLHRPSLL